MASRPRQVTQKDVARHCGVSPMTVSWALRGDSRHVSNETRHKVLASAAQLGYDPLRTHAARRLRYSAMPADQAPINHLVALTFMWTSIDSPYFVRLLKGLGEVLHRQGYSLLTDWSIHGARADGSLPPVFARGEVDGVICIEGSDPEQTVAVLRQDPGFGPRPVVALFTVVDDCACVLTDDREGGRLLATHLLDRGHRYLAYSAVGGHAHEERHAGYVQALRTAGLDPDLHLRAMRYRHESDESIAAALKAQRAMDPPTTAILAGNDHLATRLAGNCERLGLGIPGDLALVGYDDTHVLPDGRGGNLLTSVRYSQEAAGRRAGELLVAGIEGYGQPSDRVTLPVELVVRGSSG